MKAKLVEMATDLVTDMVGIGGSGAEHGISDMLNDMLDSFMPPAGATGAQGMDPNSFFENLKTTPVRK